MLYQHIYAWGLSMADYDLATNTYTLAMGEEVFAMPVAPSGGADASAIGNELANTITGNDGNNTIDGRDGNDTLDGGAGDDTYIATGFDEVIELAGGGMDTVRASTDFTLSDNVEKLVLIGTADLTGTGNDLDNDITGNDGKNILDGGIGADSLRGGKGDDDYVIDDEDDTVFELTGEGTDTILAAIDIDLNSAKYGNVENVALTGSLNLDVTGNDLGNEIYGNDGDNILLGGKGDDLLYGGIGTDQLTGGEGDDTYYITANSDTINENAGEGTDTGVSSRAFTLVGTELENLYFEGQADINGVGNDYANEIGGNDGKNRLEGGKGADELDGGKGADTLVGGEGNDTYHVDDSGDVATEISGEGIDIIRAVISFVLPDHVEHLTLDGTNSINGTGNDLSNIIAGNDAGNTLDGKAGVDRLEGGKGNDVYVIDATDTIIELADQGTDTVEITDVYAPDVETPFSYILLDQFENLTLKGTRNLNGIGNAVSNTIIGNAGSNILTGNGGQDILIGGGGADVLIGGADDDFYFIDSSNDIVTETSTGGTFDRVIAKASFVLGENIEYLALENIGGSINGTGNALDNIIFGNEGNNILYGGAGRDQLFGATGNDTVDGGDGDDTINESGDGSDSLKGGAGNDDIRAEGGSDILDGGIGADSLKGGTGSDTYMVDNAFDKVIESVGQGTDKVFASVSFTLTAASSVEALTAKVGTASINLSGNEFANTIKGNAGKNKLSGMDGNDALTGGAGRDTFVFKTKLNKKTNLDKIIDYKVIEQHST
jgi:Ca2+-binding RTX toxin-like protein